MPKQIDPYIKERVQRIWYENRKKSKTAIHQLVLKEFGDPKDGGESPSYRTISNWIDKYRPGDLPPDEPLDIWEKKWTDPDSFRTLLVLIDTARSACRENGVEYLEGLTEREAIWACRLRPFFDLEASFDCLALLEFAVIFAAGERFTKEMNRPRSSDGDDSRLLMAWHWKDGEPKLSHKILETEREARWLIPFWEQGEENMAWSLSRHFDFRNKISRNQISMTREYTNRGNA